MPDERYVPMTAVREYVASFKHSPTSLCLAALAVEGRLATGNDIILDRADAEHFATATLRHLALVGCPICDRFRAAVLAASNPTTETKPDA